jgi:hypothetical protein
VPPRGGIQPTRLLADYRGAGPSHVWVVGDGAVGDVYHLDFTGTLIHVTSTGSQLGSIVQDAQGHIWVGSFGNGNLFEIDSASGAILNTFNVAPSIQGLAIDGFGDLWATSRLPAPAASEVRRIDRSTGAVQVAAAVGVGAQSALATLFHHAHIVDPSGDLDGDGLFNQFETYYGCSPRERCSYGNYSVAIRGSSRIGTAARLDLGLPGLTPTLAYFYAFASSTVAPGSGVTLPQVGCEALLALPALSSGFVNGTGSLALPIPNRPSLGGMVVFLQALAVDPFGAIRFTNVSALKVSL